ncbi:MAG: CmcI family methyltransferase [Proteobacteria bacterium]|nr:CmcI family methyltransferase [Pseudomonadota bacterium]
MMKRFVIFLLILFFTGLPSYLSNASENVSDSEIVKNFTHHFFEYYTKDPAIMYGSTFLGLVLMQNPADMWIMQEIITEIRPDFIIETGTFAGGAALYYATILNQVNNKGKVITVDIDPKPRIFNINKLKKDNDLLYKTVKELNDNYIEFITSNSVEPALIERLKKQTKNKKVLVTLDSCHSYEHVLKELTLYSQLVSPGSYLIAQDTFLDDKEEWIEKYAKCPGWKIKGGPRKAVNEFLRENRDFKVDKSKERFLFTFYPSGYLKKVIEQ